MGWLRGFVSKFLFEVPISGLTLRAWINLCCALILVILSKIGISCFFNSRADSANKAGKDDRVDRVEDVPIQVPKQSLWGEVGSLCE